MSTALPIGYNTHTASDRREMLQAIGLSSIEELFIHIPGEIKFKDRLAVDGPFSEWELGRHIRDLANRNETTRSKLSFLGGGYYDHYIPAVVDDLSSRGEFLTAYTPYQPELSQGLLQGIYEYQKMISALTGLPVVNGSCYDGATALADAAHVCGSIYRDTHGHDRPLSLAVSEAIWQDYRSVIETYTSGRDIELKRVPSCSRSGQIDLEALAVCLADSSVGGFLFQSPNAFGVLEPLAKIAEICQASNTVSAVSWRPLASGLLKPPGDYGIDIVTGEGQGLGLPLNAGGPGLGIFAVADTYRDYLPGRLVGKVRDINDNWVYSLVSEKREQHVARENATSNICSNQAHNALRAAMYLSSLGSGGLRDIAKLNAAKAQYLLQRLEDIFEVQLAKAGPFFNEFLVRVPVSASVLLSRLLTDGIFAGLDKSVNGDNLILIAVTETKSKADLDYMAQMFNLRVCELLEDS